MNPRHKRKIAMKYAQYRFIMRLADVEGITRRMLSNSSIGVYTGNRHTLFIFNDSGQVLIQVVKGSQHWSRIFVDKMIYEEALGDTSSLTDLEYTNLNDLVNGLILTFVGAPFILENSTTFIPSVDRLGQSKTIHQYPVNCVSKDIKNVIKNAIIRP